MLEDVYGTRPDLLPRSMVRVVRAGRRPAWAGRPGVELLDLDTHLRYERESLGRFPRRSDGTVEWDEVAEGSVLSSAESDSVDLATVLRQSTPTAASLVFLWGSMDVPSVRMAPEVATEHLPAIEESTPEFWIFAPDDRVLLEQTFSGVVTVAHVPGGAEHEN